jgi:single-strand DNA-binding protein
LPRYPGQAVPTGQDERAGAGVNETVVTISGNLVSDVMFDVTRSGDAVANFRVATTTRRYDRATGRWSDGETAYYAVSCWRRIAENAKASLAKGHPVLIHGRLRQRRYERRIPDSAATIPTYSTDIEAIAFGHDLARCRSVYQRAPRGPQTEEGTGAVGLTDQRGAGIGVADAYPTDQRQLASAWDDASAADPAAPLAGSVELARAG